MNHYLEPCPFCKHAATISEDHQSIWVECRWVLCGAQSGRIHHHNQNGEIAQRHYDDVAMQWNNRVPPDVNIVVDRVHTLFDGRLAEAMEAKQYDVVDDIRKLLDTIERTYPFLKEKFR